VTAGPLLSVIIVNWNTRELLARCLESVECSGLRARPTESSTVNLQASSLQTIVVDNSSTDNSTAMVKERYPQVHVIENQENVGFARASNQGIAHATGRYVLLLNPDTKAHPAALETLVAFMETHPRAGACGARLLNVDGSLQPACHPMLTPGREFWRLLFLERLWSRATYPMHRWDSRTPRRVEVIKGACLMLRRSALDEVGLLDETYFMYTEEVDLCYRLAQAGWELWYVPAAQIVHSGEGSSRQAADAMYLELYRSKVRFYRKFGGERRARCFRRLVRLAYRPRWLIARAAMPLYPALARKARTFSALLSAVEEM
jgi:N-acetylglucosaminyl-diphospho-decaprenol L-rhamnosyltransferase